ncbi:manganese efflux pump MntP [Mogibacterium pumilum]|uniref:Putative manganese efflux pump MntP n=1 Tax=Mogibacterium pumilum TaxID=86332 RepID=A0A223ARV0_9FIRM|nr:manganese efflux pump [Mogibacterium pumilum]ASS37698.1 hypothetical protein AXF17_04005 [Mogibacterium pumilum]
MDFIFFLSSILLGIGLAMDAFAISIANGISKPDAELGYVIRVTAVFAFFQFAMPLLGWFLVHKVVKALGAFDNLVPWIALLVLGFLGVRMIREGLRNGKSESEVCIGGDTSTDTSMKVCSSDVDRNIGNTLELTAMTLLLQGIATSIDALSTGFAIVDYDVKAAFVCSTIIASTTWIMCFTGMRIGSRLGNLFSAHATIVGGVILVIIGIEVFTKGTLL